MWIRHHISLLLWFSYVAWMSHRTNQTCLLVVWLPHNADYNRLLVVWLPHSREKKFELLDGLIEPSADCVVVLI